MKAFIIRDKHGTWDTIYINFGFIGNIRYANTIKYMKEINTI